MSKTNEIPDTELINSSKQILDQLVEICNGKEAVKDSNIIEKKVNEFTETDKILYKTRKIKQASLKVEEWQEKAQKINTKPIESFLKTLSNWKDKVLNFFHQRHTNAVVEGLNNAIRGIIRRSFGFHNFENLKRRVLIELG